MGYQLKQQEELISSGFSQSVQAYFKEKYNKTGCLVYINVEYEYYPIALNDIDLVEKKNQKINEWLPFFCEKNIDTDSFRIVLPCINDFESLTTEINKRLKEDIIYITSEMINEIISSDIYKDYFHSQYIPKILSFSKNNFLYEDDETCDFIDAANFPSNIPEKTICEELDCLLMAQKLHFIKAKYAIKRSNGQTHTTQCFKECTYKNRRFIRYRFADNSEFKFCWLEIKPVEIDAKTKIKAL